MSRREWTGGQDGGPDVTGEWVGCNSWSYRRKLRDSHTERFAIFQHVHLWQVHNRETLRAGSWGWTAHLSLRSLRFRVDAWRGYAMTRGAALRAVEALPFEDAVRGLLRVAYSPAGAVAVWRMEETGLEPWATVLPTGHDPMDYPPGEYAEAQWAHGRRVGDAPQVSVRRVVREDWGYQSSGGATAWRDASALCTWLPGPVGVLP